MPLAIKVLVFSALVPGTIGGWLPWWIGLRTRSNAFAIGTWNTWLAFPLLVIGFAIYAWCAWDFVVAGRGTPAPHDPPRRLVVRGLYRVVRNPMYYGMLNAIAGWVVYFGSVAVLVYGVIVAVGFHVFVRFYEEPRLQRQFGEEYDRYCRAVNRWIPGRPYVARATRG